MKETKTYSVHEVHRGGGWAAEIREHTERRYWEDGKPVLMRATRAGGKLIEISAEITRRKTRKKGHATPLEAMRAYVARKESDVDLALEELEAKRQELIDARAQLKKMEETA